MPVDGPSRRPTRRDRLAAADAALSAADPVMARLVGRFGPSAMPLRPVPGGHFAALARSILHQQLAGRAASAIHGRFLALFEDGTPTPEEVVGMADAVLRSAGLSGSKASSIRDLAERVVDGRLRLDDLARRPDEEVIDRLVSVRGIGRWTAEMFLIFTLGRLDVWPVGDYGVRAGFSRAHALPDLPAPKELARLGEIYRPWRSVAAWYYWRAVEDKGLVAG
jgi:3-methyladenine DNA glycosylase/8-oxoguanine DNA glycosylase